MASPKLHLKLIFGVDDYTPQRYGTPNKPNWKMCCPPPMSVMGYEEMSRLAQEEPDKWRLVYRQDLVDRCLTTDRPNLMDESIVHPALFQTKIGRNFHRKYGHELFHLTPPKTDNPDHPTCSNIAGFVVDEIQEDSPIAYAFLQSYEGGIPNDTSNLCGWHKLPTTPLEFDSTQEARFIRLKQFNEQDKKLLPSANNRFNQRIAIKQRLIEREWNYTSFSPSAIEIWSIAARYIFQWLNVKITIEDMKLILYWERT